MSGDVTAVERLEGLLNQRDRRIEALEEKIEKMTYEDEWMWRDIRLLSENENLDLPVPRLELRYIPLKHGRWKIDYAIVYRHLEGHLQFVPLASTRTSDIKPTDLELPFRCGAQIVRDAAQLRLPAFVVNGNLRREIAPATATPDGRLFHHDEMAYISDAVQLAERLSPQTMLGRAMDLDVSPVSLRARLDVYKRPGAH